MAIYDLSGKNKYYTLYTLLREDITGGRYRAGEKLPAKRALAKELGVSVVTVQLAYEQLLAEGYAYSRERSGYYVDKVNVQPSPTRAVGERRTPENRAEEKYSVDFVRGAAPAKLFPFSVWAKLMREVLSDCGEHLLERVPIDGDWELRSEISAYLYRARGIDAPPERIVIGAGAEYLYGVIVQLLGREKLYALENPGYGKISAAYSLNGARFVPIDVLESGISAEQLAKSGAEVLHISPAHQFPTGVITPASTRSRIMEWAENGDRYIIEDDYDSEFRLSGKPIYSLHSLCPDRVVYMNTFSKSLAPSMRMGYMVLPSALKDRFDAMFSSAANVVPLFEQKTLAAMLRKGHFERHINRLKNYYRAVRSSVKSAFSNVGDCKIFDTGGGLHMLASFSRYPTDEAVKTAAAALNARVKCVGDYLIAPMKVWEGCVVLNYGGIDAESLDIFAKKLAEL